MKGNKGITLIALIVTIIVLIILAGVAIMMLAGDNGILNQASRAKYDTEIASFDERVKLTQSAMRMAITSQSASTGGYLATETNAFNALVADVVSELGAGTTAPTTAQEGFIVYNNLDQGSDSVDGNGYILVTYSSNALRSSLVKDVETMSNGDTWPSGSTTYTMAGKTDYSVNQAVLAYVINVTNYNCVLSNAVLTDTTTVADYNTAMTNKDSSKKFSEVYSTTTIGSNATF